VTQASTRILPAPARRSSRTPTRRASPARRPRRIGCHQHHQDQRAQRPGIVDCEAWRRQAGANPPDRGQRALALRLPQRQRDRIVGRQRVRQLGCRTMADAGTAIESAQGLLAARPAKPDQRPHRHHREDHEQDQPDGPRQEWQRQHRPAHDSTRKSPTTVRRRANSGQARSHASAYVARCRACASFSRAKASPSRAGSDGSG